MHATFLHSRGVTASTLQHSKVSNFRFKPKENNISDLNARTEIAQTEKQFRDVNNSFYRMAVMKVRGYAGTGLAKNVSHNLPSRPGERTFCAERPEIK